MSDPIEELTNTVVLLILAAIAVAIVYTAFKAGKLFAPAPSASSELSSTTA